MAWTFMTLRQCQGDWNPGLIAPSPFLSLSLTLSPLLYLSAPLFSPCQ